jgi:hypothetical protein
MWPARSSSPGAWPDFPDGKELHRLRAQIDEARLRVLQKLAVRTTGYCASLRLDLEEKIE